MPNLIFIDLETTGLDTETCEVIEVGYSSPNKPGKIFADTYKSENPIPPEVSGITNIDNKDVADRPVFNGGTSELYWLAETDYIAVTHNTDFDLAVLERYGIHFKRAICTHKLAWALLPDLANHKLGTLRAYFGIPHNGGGAHRASYDVQILEQVFWKLADLAILDQPMTQEEQINTIVPLSALYEAEYRNTWHFGKFKGQKIDPVIHLDYIRWNLSYNESINSKFRQHLISLCQ